MILVICMANNQCSTPHISLFNTETLVVAVGIIVDRKRLISIELCNVLLQFKPQCDCITDCFQKYWSAILVFSDTCVSIYVELAKFPPEMRIVLRDCIVFGKTGIVACIHNSTQVVFGFIRFFGCIRNRWRNRHHCYHNGKQQRKERFRRLYDFSHNFHPVIRASAGPLSLSNRRNAV